MMKKNGKTILSAIALVCLILIVVGARRRHHGETVNLNAILTNELSDTSDLRGLDKALTSFLKQWDIQGASLAIMRNDSLVYAKGYGYADDDIEMGPGHILRLASVSKLITAVGIMALQEDNLLSIDNTVFREGDILAEYSDAIKDKRCYDITIKNLLMHEAGFTTRAGDPMFSTRTLMIQNKWEEAPDSDQLVRLVLGRKLGFNPGSGSDYSNFGYLLLTLIIEKVTGQDYESWMQENVLGPAGCLDMHLAGNFYEDKRDNETRYHCSKDQKLVECFDGSGDMVERCYGGNDITALKGAGAWVASAAELARFVASIDNRDEVPDILSKGSIEQMTATTDSVTYGLGWNDISDDGIWTRTGTLSSTSALIKYYPDGECWILITNTGTYRGPHFTKYISTQFRRYREQYSEKLPHRDFFSGEF